MLLQFGRAGWVSKARQQPDKVRMIIDKIRTDGLAPTVESVFNRLDQPIPLGYCNVGTVIEVGTGVSGFAIGDRVVSNGRHAEVVSVGQNLCAKVPNGVSDDEAAFAVVSAIGLQGIRLIQPTLGEVVVVTGLGLIGLAAVQLLRAHGCRVIGLDFDASKLMIARQFGAETVDLGAGADPVAAAMALSRDRGVDAVLITAATTSDEPVHQAALMCRKRGRIVLVGVAGLQLSRADFYEKELTFQVSCSYGPGRYDPNYEDKGLDYPVGFVRWTEQRNFEAVLDMMAERRLDAEPLISHRIDIGNAEQAYELIASAAPSLGVLLQYPGGGERPESVVREKTVPIPAAHRAEAPAQRDAPRVSFIGSGNYASAVLIPAFKRAGVRLGSVASRGGVSGLHAGRKFGFEQTTTDVDAVFREENDALVVTTRHDTHAPLVIRAIEHGLAVFVEKPLALTIDEIASVSDAWRAAHARGEHPIVMIGFNRRFAPHVQKMKHMLAATPVPKVMIMTVNAGAIPASHWTRDRGTGGGRIIGEGCHFVDLLRCIAGSPIADVHAAAMGDESADDNAIITLQFADGSLGSIHYLANGHKSFPKERLEVFAAGRILQLDNFRTLRGFGWPSFSRMGLWRQDKGQRACAAAFVDAVRSGAPSPIPFDEILEVSRATIEADKRLRA